jgi:hypothetical protein
MFGPVEDIIILITLLDTVPTCCICIGWSESHVPQCWYSFICIKKLQLRL